MTSNLEDPDEARYRIDGGDPVEQADLSLGGLRVGSHTIEVRERRTGGWTAWSPPHAFQIRARSSSETGSDAADFLGRTAVARDELVATLIALPELRERDPEEAVRAAREIRDRAALQSEAIQGHRDLGRWGASCESARLSAARADYWISRVAQDVALNFVDRSARSGAVRSRRGESPRGTRGGAAAPQPLPRTALGTSVQTAAAAPARAHRPASVLERPLSARGGALLRAPASGPARRCCRSGGSLGRHGPGPGGSSQAPRALLRDTTPRRAPSIDDPDHVALGVSEGRHRHIPGMTVISCTVSPPERPDRRERRLRILDLDVEYVRHIFR